jgi:cold shock CspA family protein
VPQGTIKDYDDASRTGALLMDDKLEITIDPGSISDPAMRTLRLGQRVKFEIVEDGGAQVARELRLVTFE